MIRLAGVRHAARAHLRSVALVGLALAVAGTAPAQEPHPLLPGLPDAVAARVIAFHNAPGTVRISGDAHVAAGTTVAGPLSVLAGRLEVAGEIAGDVTVINGELHIAPGGGITGNLLVVATSLTGDIGAVRGRIESHVEPLRYRQVGMLLAQRVEVVPRISPGVDLGFGELGFRLATGSGYNRVEGLPLEFGPRLRVGTAHALVIDALGIYRTAVGPTLDPNRMGFMVRAEQRTTPHGSVRVGARVFSEVVPIESGGLGRVENSLAVFILHRDYRDHYERAGWAAYVGYVPSGAPLAVTLEYRDERHARMPLGNPWSIFHSQEPWRPPATVAAGAVRTAGVYVLYDTRNDIVDPATGWHVRLGAEQAVGSSLRRPVSSASPGERLPLFRTGTIDARRYARLSPYSRLAFRVMAAGTLDAGELPPQRQHALGGTGSLPGFAAFTFDCGARDEVVFAPDDSYFPYYGCDRAVLVQLEYQANFPYGRRLTERTPVLAGLAQTVRWVMFFDAGRAWTEPSARGARLGGEDFSASAGLGIRVGRFGIYGAVPLSGSGEDLNVFLRLEPRL